MKPDADHEPLQSAEANTRFRVLIAGLFHETHTFLDGSTPWDAFTVCEGAAILAAAGDASPIGGVLELANRLGWEIVPTITASAVPSAIVDREVFDEFWRRFEARASAVIADGIDAIYLVLHGAFVTTDLPDVEGEWLNRMRQLPGAASLPIFGVYDLHANFTQAMTNDADCLVAYRENPHRDARQSAIRAALLMRRSFDEGIRPKQFWLPAPIIWPPTGTASAVDPMKRLLHLARQLEQQHPEFWVVNVTAGFAFSDTPDTGVSFSLASTGDELTAMDALRRLVDVAIEYAVEGNVTEAPLDDVLSELKRLQRQGELRGLTVLAEPSDNIGGGGPGDGTGLLRGLIRYAICGAAVCLWDPAAVDQVQSLRAGEIVKLSLGGRGSHFDAGPIELDCQLVRVGDGLFELEDKQSHLASVCGDRFNMGRFAVVQHQGMTILLTSHRTPPMDLRQWRHAGIDPEKMSVIAVKAAVAHRQAYDRIATRHDSVATPGPCQSLLSRFPYRMVRRPVYPLDLIADIRRLRGATPSDHRIAPAHPLATIPMDEPGESSQESE